jgi:hypothetical protein
MACEEPSRFVIALTGFADVRRAARSPPADLIWLSDDEPMDNQASAAHRQEQILDHRGGRDVHAFDECLHRIAELADALSGRSENREVAGVPQDGTSAWEGDADGFTRSLIGLIDKKLPQSPFVQADGRVGRQPFTRFIAGQPDPLKLGRMHWSESRTLADVIQKGG